MYFGCKQGVKSVLCVLGVAVFCVHFSARGQLVADGTTNVLNGVTTNISGSITIGTNISFTRLILTNGAMVSNTGETDIGSSAHSNSLVVIGHGSRWNSSSTLYIGEGGSYNQLSVLNGGVVSDGGAILGYLGGSSSNLVLVSGPGSLWTNNGSIEWSKGPANQLIVSNGGTVFSYGGNIWNGGRASIAGSGSSWNSAAPLSVGSVGIGGPNQLSVSGGGAITNTGNCTIGNQSYSNSVLVADPGTVMTSFNLQLGLVSGKANQFMVSNGAAATIANSTFVASTNQRVTITGSGSLLTSQNDFYLGQTGYSNLLSVLDGGTLADTTGYIGGPGGLNQALISGANTLWTNRATLYVGYSSARNQLVISNGATVCDTNGVIGNSSIAHSNTVVVTGPGSRWTNSSALTIGTNGSFNQLFITNGAAVVAGTIYVGSSGSAGTNRVIVADPGSMLTATTNLIYIGSASSRGNQLIVSNAATVRANRLFVGDSPNPFSGNSLIVSGGNVIVTNSPLLVGQYGILTLNSGLIEANYLQAGANAFSFNGGTLRTAQTVLPSAPFVVGNGSSSATFEMLGGTHALSLGLVVASNATLKGSGTIFGNVLIHPGGTLAPGSSVGQITLNAALALSNGSTNIMEFNASNGTCDNIVGPTNLVYGGTLILSNLAGVLTNGSSFRLFSATNYSGAFSAILPPSPGPGLKWNTNELNVDGVLRVFSLQSPAPVISGVQVSGTSIQISAAGGVPYDPVFLVTTTNIASPTAWQYFSTNRLDSSGNATFNEPLSQAEPRRFFRLQAE